MKLLVKLMSLAALTFTSFMALAQVDPTVPAVSATVPVVPVKPKIDCATYTRTPVTVDGQIQMRYNLTDNEALKCITQPATPWVVMKEEWSDQDEANWEAFVTRIGKAIEAGKCHTVDTCLASSANPYYQGDLERNGAFYSDCADFPYFLRTYFAYKNNLPMSFGTGLEANAPTQNQINSAKGMLSVTQKAYDSAVAGNMSEQEIGKRQASLKLATDEYDALFNPKDMRMTRNGNHFVNRWNIPSPTGAPRNFFQAVFKIQDELSSASYRMLYTPAGSFLPDFYAPALQRESIRPGSVAYNPAGHLAVVYEINSRGDIRMMDAHPDNSVSTITFNSEFQRSVPQHASGLKNWRPIKVTNPSLDATGAIVKGTNVQLTNEEIPQFSLEQYFGNYDSRNKDHKQAKFVGAQQTMEFFDFLRFRMTNGSYKLNPIEQFKTELNDLCVDIQGRVKSVNAAILPAGAEPAISTERHPEKMESNIYAAGGRWEIYSTPGRDLRIRTRVLSMIKSFQSYARKLQNNDKFFDYRGSNMKADLIKTYNEANLRCSVTYNNSAGQPITMGLGNALKRMTQMSFDPYLCAERRWGAKYQSEVKTCADDQEKTEWYVFQQFLRNATEGDRNQVMNWTLPDLKEMARKGVVDTGDRSADYDILAKLKAL